MPVDPVRFTDKEIALIKRTVAEGATDDDSPCSCTKRGGRSWTRWPSRFTS